MDRIYLDASVFGGYFDPEFELWTKILFSRIRGYNAVNSKLGHKILEIRTPREILAYED